ncbi:MAG: PTS sugar transporter subunit IIA [bacterium]|nr:PTS sugar transporter subunit IIA [bacterium]
MKISKYLSVKRIKIGLDGINKKATLAELIDILQEEDLSIDKDAALQALLAREKLGTTGIGHGIAIPHAKLESMKDISVVLGISHKGINFKSLDGEPVYIVLLFLVAPTSAGDHLKVLAKVSRLLKDRFLREELKKRLTAEEIIRLIKDKE